MQHVAGKQFYTPDTLSWYLVGAADEKNDLNISEIEVFESQFMAEFPALDTWIQELPNISASTTISRCKAVFSSEGIPGVLRTDNGTQYSSQEFKAFAKEYGFTHITSSPKQPKVLNIAWLNFLWVDSRDTLPAAQESLQPFTVKREEFATIHREAKCCQKNNFNRHHRVCTHPPFQTHKKVWITDLQRYRRIVTEAETPRSYPVLSGRKVIRRNKHYLKSVREADHTEIEGKNETGRDLAEEEISKEYPPEVKKDAQKPGQERKQLEPQKTTTKNG
ncbi:hypothetical protein PR048_008331 [Dryococelus australis]|uniref:Integrase catalytic domain-containing protein n=1 Tax=Dryococelus australis TaxID=614101 RepID=A0ABQ9HWT3_9NEOP|nr:hypothetical protein PR048_008331 [Dryococelus australis]